MKKTVIAGAALALALSLPAAGAAAGRSSGPSSPPAGLRVALSQNERWYATVMPLAGEDACPTRTDSREDSASAETSASSGLCARIYSTQGSTFTEVAAHRLPESGSPSSLLLANDGHTLVLLRLRHAERSLGDEGAVVLYRTDGTLVRSLRLSDLLTPGDVRSLGDFYAYHRTSFPWSRAEIDESRRVLLLELDRHLPEGSPRAQAEKSPLLQVDLATGRPLQGKTDLLPQWRAFLKDLAAPAPPVLPAASRPAGACPPSFAVETREDLLHLSQSDLIAQAVEAPLPEYTSLGRRARVSGDVVIAVRIAGTGKVEEACIVKGLPLGLDRAALEAVQRWELRPFAAGGKPARAEGQLAFSFGWFFPDGSSAAP